jgi:hypothetical protein
MRLQLGCVWLSGELALSSTNCRGMALGSKTRMDLVTRSMSKTL